MKDGKLKLGKLGKIQFKYYREIPADYKIKSATITQKASGRFYISILTEYEAEVPNIVLDKNKSIGLDYSSPHFYVDNQNNEALQEHFFRESETKLAREQRKLSLMKYGSHNYYKQRQVVGRIQEHIENQRKDFIEKKSTELANNYDIVCMEDLNLKNLSQTLKLGKSTNDNGFGMFRVRLERKLFERGKTFVKIGKWFPSSKMCHFCGAVNTKLLLKDREWDCECGKHLLRDQNAAINILNEGLRLLEQ